MKKRFYSLAALACLTLSFPSYAMEDSSEDPSNNAPVISKQLNEIVIEQNEGKKEETTSIPSYLLKLPDELLFKTFSYLNFKDLSIVMLTNKKLKQIAEDDRLNVRSVCIFHNKTDQDIYISPLFAYIHNDNYITKCVIKFELTQGEVFKVLKNHFPADSLIFPLPLGGTLKTIQNQQEYSFNDFGQSTDYRFKDSEFRFKPFEESVCITFHKILNDSNAPWYWSRGNWRWLDYEIGKIGETARSSQKFDTQLYFK